MVSTGQGLLGNNMFAYCLNNPVALYDPNGLVAGCSACDMYLPCDRVDCPYIMKKREEKGVYFEPDKNRNGGIIYNSWKISSSREMYKYMYYLMNESEYKDCFSGSVEGALFEWDFHNQVYNFPILPDGWRDSAKDVNLGSTIFRDSHGLKSAAMWLMYYLAFPDTYIEDLFA